MKNYLAEFLGTFALVFFGTGSIVINEQTNGTITHGGISLTFGLTVMCMIYALGNISGAHLNPAVSIAFTVAKRFSMRQLPGYLIVQVAGALLASTSLKFLFPNNVLLGATLPSGSLIQSFVLEFILTFFLMLIIFRFATGAKEQGMFAGVAIGAFVTLAALFGGPISGASMNPARTLGPALASWHLENVLLYLSAPVLGALLAIPVSRYFYGRE